MGSTRIGKGVKLDNLINDKKKYISLFAGSRESEIKIHAPILFEFINIFKLNINSFICYIKQMLLLRKIIT